MNLVAGLQFLRIVQNNVFYASVTNFLKYIKGKKGGQSPADIILRISVKGVLAVRQAISSAPRIV